MNVDSLDGHRLGATVIPAGVIFRVFAPDHATVDFAFNDARTPGFRLQPDGRGYFSGLCTDARAGDLYRYRLSGAATHPDPYSQFFS